MSSSASGKRNRLDANECDFLGVPIANFTTVPTWSLLMTLCDRWSPRRHDLDARFVHVLDGRRSFNVEQVCHLTYGCWASLNPMPSNCRYA